MERIEQELRAGLARAVESPPAVAGLGDKIIDQGRRVRRRRRAAAGAAVAVVLVVAGVLLTPALSPSRTAEPAEPKPVPTSTVVPTGGPRAAVTLESAAGTSILWPGTERRETELTGDLRPLAVVPAGLVLMSTGTAPFQLSVQAGPDARWRAVASDLFSDEAAISPDGRRVTVVHGSATQRELREVEVASGKVLRTVPLSSSGYAEDGERWDPVAYAGDAVMIVIGEGAAQRIARWDSGSGQAIGNLGLVTYRSVVAGGANGALAVTGADQSCTDIGIMVTSFVSGEICAQDFIGFSPDGSLALTLTTDNRHLIVRGLRNGARLREFVASRTIRAAGWEDQNTLLYSTYGNERAKTYRCLVATGECREIVTGQPLGSILSPLPVHGL